MWAFCIPSSFPTVARRRLSSHAAPRPSRLPIVAARKSSSSDSKRPLSKPKASSGFSAARDDTETLKQLPNPEESSDAAVEDKLKSGVDLKSVDSRGISLEHRLKEEIKHPLRKPKQTLFATLSFSAFLASPIAISRFVTHADSIQQLSINLLINITAVATFGYLTWRQVQFGRRALNSFAGRPQLRDLPIASPSEKLAVLPSLLRAPKRMSSLLRRSDVILLIGRRIQMYTYLARCKETFDVMPSALVIFPTDVNSSEEQFPIQPDAIPDRENDGNADWKAWIADVVPARRNIVVLRISRNDDATAPANAFLVEDGDAKSVSLPFK
ncbi:unnamed protein product [Agarophyton chilense]